MKEYEGIGGWGKEHKMEFRILMQQLSRIQMRDVTLVKKVSDVKKRACNVISKCEWRRRKSGISSWGRIKVRGRVRKRIRCQWRSGAGRRKSKSLPNNSNNK